MTTMLLQDAIILGDTLKKGDPEQWLSWDGSCGCAFGGALLAVGVTAEEFNYQAANFHMAELPAVRSRWPWIKPEHLYAISQLYREAAHGQGTIEDVAAYVRSIEPVPQIEALRPTETRELVTA